MTVEKIDIEFDDAFDAFANGEEVSEDQKDSQQAPEDTEESETTESEDSSEETPDDSQSDDEEATDDEDSSDDEPFDDPKDNKDDLEAKYRDAMAQLRLTASRLDSLSGQYQELKQQVSHSKKEQEKAKQEFVEPEAFKNLREDWPEVAEALDAILSAKLEHTKSNFESVISEKVKPVEYAINNYVVDSHVAAIQRAHPDVIDIVASGELDAWQATLSPWEQRGVQMVRDAGTAEEVIELLNQYKSSKGESAKKPRANKKPAHKPEQSSDSFDYDILIEKLKAASVVPSSKSTPNLNAGETTTPAPDDFDAAFEEALKRG